MASNDDFTGEESELEEEVGVLKEIYINELEVHKDQNGGICGLSLVLHPATGDQMELKWVCLTLVLTIPPGYPDEAPEIQIKNPRGLAEDHVSSLEVELVELATERRGMCMMFELIELAKESLTQGNIPDGECVICKEDFIGSERFTKTECYHYFHCHCLLRYVEHSEAELEEEYQTAMQHSSHMNIERKKVVCPVCRDPFTYDLTQLRSYPAPSDLDPGSVTLSPNVLLIQHQMAAMFRRQKDKGGIIDVEAEKNKFLVTADSSHTLSYMVDVSSVAPYSAEQNTEESIQNSSGTSTQCPDLVTTQPSESSEQDKSKRLTGGEDDVDDHGIEIIVKTEGAEMDVKDVFATDNDAGESGGTKHHNNSRVLTKYHAKSRDGASNRERSSDPRTRSTENGRQQDDLNHAKSGRSTYHRDVNSRDRYRRDKRNHGYRETGCHRNKDSPRDDITNSKDEHTRGSETDIPIATEPSDKLVDSNNKFTNSSKNTNFNVCNTASKKTSQRNETRSQRHRGYDRNHDYHVRGYHGNDHYHDNKRTNRNHVHEQPEDWHDNLFEVEEMSTKSDQNKLVQNPVSVDLENPEKDKDSVQSTCGRDGAGGRGTRRFYNGYKHDRTRYGPRDRDKRPRDSEYRPQEGGRSPRDIKEDWHDDLIADDQMDRVDAQAWRSQQAGRRDTHDLKEGVGYRDRTGRGKYTGYSQTKSSGRNQTSNPHDTKQGPSVRLSEDPNPRYAQSELQNGQRSSRNPPNRHSYNRGRGYRHGTRDKHHDLSENTDTQPIDDKREQKQDPRNRQNVHNRDRNQKQTGRDGRDVQQASGPDNSQTSQTHSNNDRSVPTRDPARRQNSYNQTRGYRHVSEGAQSSARGGRYRPSQSREDVATDKAFNHRDPEERPGQSDVQDIKKYVAKSPERPRSGASDTSPKKQHNNQVSSRSFDSRVRHQQQSNRSDPKNDFQSRPRAENQTHKFSDHHYSNRREGQRRHYGKSSHDNKHSKSEDAVS